LKLAMKIIKNIFAAIGILGVGGAAITYLYLVNVYKSDGFGGVSYLVELAYNKVQGRISSMETNLLKPKTYRVGEGDFQNFISFPKNTSKTYQLTMTDRPQGILRNFSVNPASIKNDISQYALKTYVLSSEERLLARQKAHLPQQLKSDFEKCVYLCALLYGNNHENLMPTANQDMFELMSRVLGGNEVACHEISLVFQYMASSLGIYTRSVCASDDFASNSSLTKGGTHCMLEAYCREIDKWVLFDPFYNRYFTDKNKVPLSMLDVRDKLYEGEEVLLGENDYLKKSDFYYKYAVFVFNNSGVLYLDSRITDNPIINTTDNRSYIYLSLKNSSKTKPIIKKLFSSAKRDFFTLQRNLLPLGTIKILNDDVVEEFGKIKNLYPLLKNCSLSDSGTIVREEGQNRIHFRAKMSGSASFLTELDAGVYYIIRSRSVNENKESSHRINIISKNKKISVIRVNMRSANTSILIRGDGKIKVEFVGSPTNAPSLFSVSSIELIRVS